MNLPEKLWLVRHGESLENVARHFAEANGNHDIIFPQRQSDVPLSDIGKKQAVQLGEWFAALPETDRPNGIYSSSFVRALETAELIAENGGLDLPEIVVDERLREREQGIFQRLTVAGAIAKYPEECARREQIGKYYYRAPGGESWCDVILRLRSFWRDLREAEIKGKVLLVTHEAVIRCFRCVVEGLTEEQIMEIDRQGDIHNGAITEYKFEANSGKLVLSLDNVVPQS